MMMKIPAVKGTFARRILANYRANPETVAAQLPARFRPKLHAGHAMVGVCLIRLENLRPTLSPLHCGFSSENAAHRMAVEWDEDGEVREGVFVPRRDTNSLVSHLGGGRLFPGEQHLAEFRVCETATKFDVQMRSRDGEVEVHVAGEISGDWPASSIFASLDEASAFFERGCLGYSARCDSDILDGLTLQTPDWKVQALAVSDVKSSVFDDREKFPVGTVEFDHALLMLEIEHSWVAAKEL